MEATGHCPNLSAPEETIAAIQSLSDADRSTETRRSGRRPRGPLRERALRLRLGRPPMAGSPGSTRRWRPGWAMRPKALVGRRFQDLLNIAGKIYYETHFAPLLRMQGFFNEVALDLVAADGRPLPVLVNAVERRDEAGGRALHPHHRLQRLRPAALRARAAGGAPGGRDSQRRAATAQRHSGAARRGGGGRTA